MNIDVPPPRLVEALREYGPVLWEAGSHRDNCFAFIHEIDELMVAHGRRNLDDELIDFLIKSFRARNNSNATINRKLAAFYKLTRKAERNGLISRLPSYVRLPEKNGRIRFLTLEEERALFAAMGARNPDHGRLCEFLVDSGARVGEALTLARSDVENGRATFWVTKSGRSRTVPLTRRALEAASCGQSPRGPFAEIAYPRFLYDWNKAKEDCGLGQDKQVVPHILRHTCASRLVQAGVDLRRVQTFLGHQTIQMTLRYAHLATGDLDQCVAALELATADQA